MHTMYTYTPPHTHMHTMYTYTPTHTHMHTHTHMINPLMNFISYEIHGSYYMDILEVETMLKVC